MPEQQKPAKRHVALRRGATEDGIAAELMMLLETITADGSINDAEAGELKAWLDANRDSELPSIDFLRTTLDQILADGRVTAEERKALHRAVERVLPAELREKAKGRRVATELLDKAREREEKAAARSRATEEREKNYPDQSANFMIAGVLYEGRAKIVDKYLRSGQTVFLARDPGNQYDSNAIEIRLREGFQIGYVPREDAREIAPLLDQGYRQAAYCTKILKGQRAPIPVVQADIYRADTTMGGAISNSEVPALKAAVSGAGCTSLVTLAAGLFVAFLVLFLLNLR
jgi:uncharacterized tellurite resistance protein B-like protein